MQAPASAPSDPGVESEVAFRVEPPSARGHEATRKRRRPSPLPPPPDWTQQWAAAAGAAGAVGSSSRWRRTSLRRASTCSTLAVSDAFCSSSEPLAQGAPRSEEGGSCRAVEKLYRGGLVAIKSASTKKGVTNFDVSNSAHTILVTTWRASYGPLIQ